MKQSVHFTMLISIPSAVGLCVLAYPVMQVLFPQRDTIDLAVGLLRIGCVSVVFYCLSTVTNGVLQGIGKGQRAASAMRRYRCCFTCFCWRACCTFTNMDLLALVFATMLYAFLMCRAEQHQRPPVSGIPAGGEEDLCDSGRICGGNGRALLYFLSGTLHDRGRSTGSAASSSAAGAGMPVGFHCFCSCRIFCTSDKIKGCI